jgi:hypothetical protein
MVLEIAEQTAKGSRQTWKPFSVSPKIRYANEEVRNRARESEQRNDIVQSGIGERLIRNALPSNSE